MLEQPIETKVEWQKQSIRMGASIASLATFIVQTRPSPAGDSVHVLVDSYPLDVGRSCKVGTFQSAYVALPKAEPPSVQMTLMFAD